MKTRICLKYYANDCRSPSGKRYTEKINVIGGIDPYVTESEKFDCTIENVPAATYSNMLLPKKVFRKW